MPSKPYIGITGPVSYQEVDSVIAAYVAAPSLSHQLMLGFLASYKTLRGEPTQNKRYPECNKIPWLIEHAGNRILPMIHYDSKEPDLAAQIMTLYYGLQFHKPPVALQLNIPWPDITQVKMVKEFFPLMQIVFQANASVTEGKKPKEIAEGIKKYGDSLNYVLIDPSGGKGIEFNMAQSLALYQEMHDKCPHLAIGFAGGFTRENVAHRLELLIAALGTTQFCIDAEDGLRDKLSPLFGDDLLNISKTESYLRNAVSVLK